MNSLNVQLGSLALLIALAGPARFAIAQSGTDKACKGQSQEQAIKGVKARLAAEEARIDHVVEQCVADVRARAQSGMKTLDGCESCSFVEKEQNLQKLREIRDRQIGKCTNDGAASRLAYIRVENEKQIHRLEELRGQFRGVTEAFHTWGDDARAGYDETRRKIAEVALSSVLSFLMEREADDAIKSYDQLIGQAQKAPNVRRIKPGELHDFVLGIRAEIKGKSAKSAKRILLDRLRSERRSVEDLDAVYGLLVKYDAKILVSADADSSEPLFKALEASYDVVLTGTTLAYQHGVKALGSLAKITGILGLAPDMVDTAALLLRTYADGSNLDGIESLRLAASQKRAIAACELGELIKAQKHLRLEQKLVAQNAP